MFWATTPGALRFCCEAGSHRACKCGSTRPHTAHSRRSRAPALAHALQATRLSPCASPLPTPPRRAAPQILVELKRNEASQKGWPANFTTHVRNVAFERNSCHNGGAVSVSESEAWFGPGVLFDSNTATDGAGEGGALAAVTLEAGLVRRRGVRVQSSQAGKGDAGLGVWTRYAGVGAGAPLSVRRLGWRVHASSA
eukprot:356671-Chlamydomonas_euryale.AAC.2